MRVRGWRARPLCTACAKCCMDTEMILLPEDVSRIESLGYRREEFTVVRNGFLVLRNVDGRCFFLDPRTRKCRIYSHRPVGCRLYPLIYVEGKGVVPDPECPLSGDVRPEELSEARRVFPLILRRLGAG